MPLVTWRKMREDVTVKRNLPLRMNLLVCLVIVAGFAITTYVGYHLNYVSSLKDIAQITDLASEGMYHQVTSAFSKPVNISLTMANDQMLAAHLERETSSLDDDGYVAAIRNYLAAYRDQYGYDSVFLASAATGRYYNFDGIDRVLTPENPENHWFFDLLDSGEAYSLIVDNDEAEGADNRITLFVNCKIAGRNGQALGVVGVGVPIDSLQAMLAGYGETVGVDAFLVDQTGAIQISAAYTGYRSVDLFEAMDSRDIRDQVLSWRQASQALTLWTRVRRSQRYVVTRYIPELNWHLVAQRDTASMLAQLHSQLWTSLAVSLAIVAITLAAISYVIHSLTHQIITLSDERRAVFRRATEQMYDDIYEVNITENRVEGERTRRYFESLGVPPSTPFDQGLKVIARKQVKKEFRQIYLDTFHPDNVLRELTAGNHHLRCDFLNTVDGCNYFWMRIDAYVERWPEDNSVHMFVYRKNIDQEKQREMQLARQAQTDCMTGLLSRIAVQDRIDQMLSDHPDRLYAFFIFDIDNFKQANDRHGHAFGDQLIGEFTGILRRNFRQGDVLGRIGGDEFVAFIPIPSEKWVEDKAQSLCLSLCRTYTADDESFYMSASIGIAIAPRDGSDRPTLYRCADAALYQTKERGKNGYTIYRG